jgi:hypothetical protein
MFASSEWNLLPNRQRNFKRGFAGNGRQPARVMRNSCTRRAKFRAENVALKLTKARRSRERFLNYRKHDKSFQTADLDCPADDRGIGGAFWLVGKP